VEHLFTLRSKKIVYIFTLLNLLISSTLNARTLKELAIHSNAILAASDNNLCQLSSSEISKLSQNLQSQIDHKIQNLKNKDYAIIKSRLNTCSNDCTCDIYALAFEKNEMTDTANLFSKKAELITAQSRLHCFKKFSSCKKLKNTL